MTLRDDRTNGHFDFKVPPGEIIEITVPAQEHAAGAWCKVESGALAELNIPKEERLRTGYEGYWLLVLKSQLNESCKQISE